MWSPSDFIISILDRIFGFVEKWIEPVVSPAFVRIFEFFKKLANAMRSNYDELKAKSPFMAGLVKLIFAICLVGLICLFFWSLDYVKCDLFKAKRCD